PGMRGAIQEGEVAVAVQLDIRVHSVVDALDEPAVIGEQVAVDVAKELLAKKYLPVLTRHRPAPPVHLSQPALHGTNLADQRVGPRVRRRALLVYAHHRRLRRVDQERHLGTNAYRCAAMGEASSSARTSRATSSP